MSIGEYTNQGQLKSVIGGGYKQLSANETVDFKRYVKVVLSSDGTVFWVKADNTNPANSISILGSVHISTDQKQNVDETIGINAVKFTTQERVQLFNNQDEISVYIGEHGGVRFAFTANAPYFVEAGTLHYWGDAIYPPMADLIIDDPNNFSTDQVATDSTPIWLALNAAMHLYPQFAVPSNIKPKYGVIRVMNTEILGAMPIMDKYSNTDRLVKDTVEIISYGLKQSEALDFVQYVFDSQGTASGYGCNNFPNPIDEKRTQSELGILAIKKRYVFVVNYYQSVVRDKVRQLILAASATVIPVTNY